MSQWLNKDKTIPIIICGWSSCSVFHLHLRPHHSLTCISQRKQFQRTATQTPAAQTAMHDSLLTTNLYSRRSYSLQTFPICFARMMPDGVPKGWTNFSMSVSDHSSADRPVIKIIPFCKQELYWYISFTNKMFLLRVCSIYLLRHPQVALSFCTVLTARNK